MDNAEIMIQAVTRFEESVRQFGGYVSRLEEVLEKFNLDRVKITDLLEEIASNTDKPYLGDGLD